MDKVEAKEVGRIAGLVARAGKDIDMSGMAHCSPLLAEAMCSAVNLDGSVHNVACVHHANILVPAGGVVRGSRSFHVVAPPL